MKVNLTSPPMCKTCGKDFAEGEERVVIVRNAAPVEKQIKVGERWGVKLEDGDPLYTIEAHHADCAPGREAA